MSRLLALLALLVLAPPSAATAAEGRPTRATLQKVMELHERSVVRVRGPRRTGPGVIVGSGGHVLTSVEHVSLDTGAEVRHDGHTLPASVVASNGTLKFAVVAAPSGSYPAVPVKVVPAGAVGEWFIGVVRGRDKRDKPVAAQARKAPEPFFDVDLALAPGSPLFDASGKMVAVAVQRRGQGCRALPLGAVKLHLGTAAADP